MKDEEKERLKQEILARRQAIVAELEGELPEEKAIEVAAFLSGGYITHDRPISLEAVRGLGLPVVEGVPAEVYHLFQTCAFGVCKRPCLASYDREVTL